MAKISKIRAREVLDSRGNPTVMAEVVLSDGKEGCAIVPSGASKGKYEAMELRDTDSLRYHKRGVLAAVKNVVEVIAPALSGLSAYNQTEADSIMIALDGSLNKSNLGANAILSVSLALSRAAASSLGIPLYRYLGGALVNRLPVPMMNVLNGGAHAKNNIDVQEFMIVPVGAASFSEGVRMCAEVYRTLYNNLLSSRLETSVGDEGGFAPSLPDDEEAIKLLLRSVESAGYRAGEDFMLALDVASSDWWTGGGYVMPKRNKKYTSDEIVGYFLSLCEKYPILSLEDAVGEEDFYGWSRITEAVRGRQTVLVGDDFFVTDERRIREGIERKLANAVLIKPNQIGTLSETWKAINVARSGGYKTIMSHRSADSEDSFIADFAVGASCELIKCGAPARAERTAKYNRLMKIESEIYMSSYGV